MKRFMLFAVAAMLALPLLARAANGGAVETYYPMPGEEITDRLPMIFMMLPQPDPPINATTIQVFLDGNDITSELQLNPEYVTYNVPAPLSLGNHTVTVNYKDIAGTAATPIKWDFTVVAQVTKAVTPRAEGRPSTTGSMVIKFEDIDLNAGTRNAGHSESDIRYRETINSLGSFKFEHKHNGVTYNGNYERAVEQITGRRNDWFSFNLTDDSRNISLGDIPMNTADYSAMTITGVKMRGIRSIHQLNEKYSLTLLAGRTTEPQNGRFKRYTRGFKLDTKSSKNNVVRLIVLGSDEKGVVSGSDFPSNDTILGLVDTFTYDNHWKLDSESVLNKHTERANTTVTDSGRDAATRYVLNFKSTRVEALAARRSIGPIFTPTTLGAYTETDREGSYGSIQYKPSSRFLVKTFFDAYHNNLHHNANTNNYTDRSENSITNLKLDYPRFPVLDARYSKLYTNTDALLGNPDTQRSESTSANFALRQDLNDWWHFNGTNLSHVFTRYDIDRNTYSSTGLPSNSNMRSDTRTWSFRSHYKAFATFSYNTSLNKTFNVAQAQVATLLGFDRTLTIDDTRSNTDTYAIQLQLIPFKLISNISYKRTAKNTYTTKYTNDVFTSFSLSSAPRDRQFIIGFIYQFNPNRKINIEYEDFDQEYRSAAAVDIGRNYDEQILRVSYSIDF